MHYCGVVPARGLLQLAMLEELRAPEPPIRLDAVFFEPGSPRQVASELRALGDVVVSVGAPTTEPGGGRVPRGCDEDLRRRGVPPQPWDVHARELYAALADLGAFTAPEAGEGPVPEGSYRDAPLLETNADGVFCALRGRRLPAKRHPLGMRLRIEELEHDHVVDSGGDLWDRRIEEIDAAAAALCAHRYAVGHAYWVGAPDEGTVVLPGSSLPERFDAAGVLPPVERLQLPPVD